VNEPDAVGAYKEKVRQEPYVKELMAGCPRDYVALMRLIDDLRYFDAPPYQQIYAMLRSCLAVIVYFYENLFQFQTQGGNDRDPYDWECGTAALVPPGGTAGSGGFGANRPFF
jgi:hypothetical protein